MWIIQRFYGNSTTRQNKKSVNSYWNGIIYDSTRHVAVYTAAVARANSINFPIMVPTHFICVCARARRWGMKTRCIWISWEARVLIDRPDRAERYNSNHLYRIPCRILSRVCILRKTQSKKKKKKTELTSISVVQAKCCGVFLFQTIDRVHCCYYNQR